MYSCVPHTAAGTNALDHLSPTKPLSPFETVRSIWLSISEGGVAGREEDLDDVAEAGAGVSMAPWAIAVKRAQCFVCAGWYMLRALTLDRKNVRRMVLSSFQSRLLLEHGIAFVQELLSTLQLHENGLMSLSTTAVNVTMGQSTHLK